MLISTPLLSDDTTALISQLWFFKSAAHCVCECCACISLQGRNVQLWKEEICYYLPLTNQFSNYKSLWTQKDLLRKAEWWNQRIFLAITFWVGIEVTTENEQFLLSQLQLLHLHFRWSKSRIYLNTDPYLALPWFVYFNRYAAKCAWHVTDPETGWPVPKVQLCSVGGWCSSHPCKPTPQSHPSKPPLKPKPPRHTPGGDTAQSRDLLSDTAEGWSWATQSPQNTATQIPAQFLCWFAHCTETPLVLDP